ncbi:MAG: response regulator [Anaerolineae bacterium]
MPDVDEVDVAGGLAVAHVRRALESLYDNPALADCALAGHFQELASVTGVVERAQWLRSLLLDAIEALRPLHHGQDYAQASRDWQVLSLRFVSGLSAEQIAEELFVGRRQVYRDLSRAEIKLCDVLRSRAQAPEDGGVDSERTDVMRREVSSMQQSAGTLDARELLLAALHTVQSLAQSRHIALTHSLPSAPLLVSGAPGVLRVAITQLLSGVIQATSGPDVTVSLSFTGSSPTLRTRFLAEEPQTLAALADSTNSARLVGLECRLRRAGLGEWELEATLAAPLPKRILVVEDNPAATELYERYLAGTGWQVISLREATDVAALVRSQRPGAIILDVMMPEVDGWTVLQDLRVDPDTAGIPVIVCSVVYDPGLAQALGANACLPKPVSRSQLLAALERALAQDGPTPPPADNC